MAKIPSAETHLISLPGYAAAVIDLYLKDESTHPRAASSTGWPGRCSSLRCAVLGC